MTYIILLMEHPLNATRKAELRVFYALHHRYRPGDYETWKYIAPVQKAAWLRKAFEYGMDRMLGPLWRWARISFSIPGFSMVSVTNLLMCSTR